MDKSQKKFAIAADRIRQLLPPMGGCLASDRITVDGKPVSYMYREKGDDEYDSGLFDGHRGGIYQVSSLLA
jgi:hypothetical protein